MKKTIKKAVGMSKGKMVALGAGAVALGAGAYYLLGPSAKKHQKKVKALLIKMKTEVVNKVKKANNLTTPLYNKMVDSVAVQYAKQYNAHQGEIKSFAKKLKGELRGIEKLANKGVDKVAEKLKPKK